MRTHSLSVREARTASFGKSWGADFRRSFLSMGVACLSLTIAMQARAQSQAAAPEGNGAANAQRSALDQGNQQPAGSISGTIVDGSGSAVAGAMVTLGHDDSSPKQRTMSGDNGQFSFANVGPGMFRVTISATGFAMQSFTGTLHAGEIFAAPPVTLTLAAAVSEVEVVAPREEVAEAEIKAQEKQRVLGFVPNFYVTYSADAVPLSPKQKFELAWRTSIDPVTFAISGGIAGIQQAQNRFREYGQGTEGYGKRFGAAYGNTVIGTFIGSAILPSLLKQDPRYFYKGTGSTRSRVLYAIATSVITKGDNKRWQPNYSGILGGFAASGIANAYYPAPDRDGAALTFENALIGIGTTAASNLFQEFLVRKLTPNLPHHDPAKS
jgi:hypothetical protein